MSINPRAGDVYSDGHVRDATFGDLAVKVNSGNVSLSTADIEVGKVKVLGSDGSTVADVLSAAPGSDTGQNGVAVRVISQLGAGTGGGAGGLTDTQLRASPVPISGSVTGPLTDTQLRASAVPVSGAFFQATQPVSGTVTATGPLTDTQLRASAVPVSMATQNPDVIDRAARLLGHVTVDSAPTTAVTGPLTDTQLRASAVPVTAAQATAANLQATVTQQTLTKGTQGAAGVSTQDLKDAGRTRVTIGFQAVAPATADTLLSLVKTSAGVAAAGATSIAVAANKTLRITAITFSLKAGAAAAAFGTLTLRSNPAGATIITSQSELRLDVGNTEAVIGAARAITQQIPDGMEFKGTETIGVSLAAQATTNVVSISLTGFEY